MEEQAIRRTDYFVPGNEVNFIFDYAAYIDEHKIDEVAVPITFSWKGKGTAINIFPRGSTPIVKINPDWSDRTLFAANSIPRWLRKIFKDLEGLTAKLIVLSQTGEPEQVISSVKLQDNFLELLTFQTALLNYIANKGKGKEDLKLLAEWRPKRSERNELLENNTLFSRFLQMYNLTPDEFWGLYEDVAKSNFDKITFSLVDYPFYSFRLSIEEVYKKLGESQVVQGCKFDLENIDRLTTYQYPMLFYRFLYVFYLGYYIPKEVVDDFMLRNNPSTFYSFSSLVRANELKVEQEKEEPEGLVFAWRFLYQSDSGQEYEEASTEHE